MSGQPRVSVVVPCYNHGEYLPEAVGSVTGLGRDDVEIVVVDDGSTDERTLREMNVLRARGIRVIRQENRGLAAARNAGIRASRADFILPLDSDNRIREAYLTKGVAMLEGDSALGVVYGDAEYFGDRTGRWQVEPFDLGRLALGNYIDACALFRKSLWDSIGGYDERMPRMGWEDWDFWLRAAVRGFGFAHVDAIAFDYRVRENSMLSTTNRHVEELLEYIFSKPDAHVLRPLRELGLEALSLRERVRVLEASRDYRLGRKILDPVRTVVGFLTGRGGG